MISIIGGRKEGGRSQCFGFGGTEWFSFIHILLTSNIEPRLRQYSSALAIYVG
jgi:hypothetical protein